MPIWRPEYLSCYPHVVIREVEGGGTMDIRHTKTRTITLSDGTLLQKRTRAFSLHVQESFKYVNPRIPGDSVYNGTALTGDRIENPLYGAIAEDITTVDNELLFMDARYGLVSTKKQEQHLTFNRSSSDTVRTRSWSPFRPILGTTLVDFRCDIVTTTTNSDVVDGKVVTSVTNTGHYDQPIAWGIVGMQNWLVPLGKDIWYVPDYSADGKNDLYYPEWMRNLGKYTLMDIDDRNLYLATAVGTVTSPMGNYEIPQRGNPVGSWAVDRDGNRFYSQALTSGADYSVLITKAGTVTDPQTVAEMKGVNQKFWPIAPI